MLPGAVCSGGAAAPQAGARSRLRRGLPEVSRPTGQAVLRGGHRPRSRSLLPRHSDFLSATSGPAPATPAQLSCPAPWAQAASRPPPRPRSARHMDALALLARADSPRLLVQDGREARQRAAGVARSQGRSLPVLLPVAAACAVVRWTLRRGHMAGPLPGPRDGLSAFHFGVLYLPKAFFPDHRKGVTILVLTYVIFSSRFCQFLLSVFRGSAAAHTSGIAFPRRVGSRVAAFLCFDAHPV